MPRLTILVAAGACLATAGCIHVSDTGVHDSKLRTAHCAVDCPDHGEARAACAVPEVPACSCEPKPVATCTAPNRRGG